MPINSAVVSIVGIVFYVLLTICLASFLFIKFNCIWVKKHSVNIRSFFVLDSTKGGGADRVRIYRMKRKSIKYTSVKPRITPIMSTVKTLSYRFGDIIVAYIKSINILTACSAPL